MRQQTSCKLVPQRAQPQSVLLTTEHRLPLGIGNAHMKMQSTTGCMGQWLGHAAKHHSMPLGHRMGRDLEQHESICGGKCVVKSVVHLVLPCRVLMVDLLDIKTQTHQSLAHVVQIGRVAVYRLQVVRRFGQLVTVIGNHPTAISLIQQKELWLYANPHGPTARAQPLNGFQEQLPRARFQRNAAGIAITDGVRHSGHERQRAYAFRNDAPVVFTAWTKPRQTRTPDARAGEASADLHPLLQVRHRDQFALCYTVDVRELRQERMDALRAQRLNKRRVIMHKNPYGAHKSSGARYKINSKSTAFKRSETAVHLSQLLRLQQSHAHVYASGVPPRCCSPQSQWLP